jgi:hypothetical protein
MAIVHSSVQTHGEACKLFRDASPQCANKARLDVKRGHEELDVEEPNDEQACADFLRVSIDLQLHTRPCKKAQRVQ